MTKQKNQRALCASAQDFQKLSKKQKANFNLLAVRNETAPTWRKVQAFEASFSQQCKHVLEGFSETQPGIYNTLLSQYEKEKDVTKREKVLLEEVKKEAFVFACANSELTGTNNKGQTVPAIWVEVDKVDKVLEGIRERNQPANKLDGGKEYTRQISVKKQTLSRVYHEEPVLLKDGTQAVDKDGNPKTRKVAGKWENTFRYAKENRQFVKVQRVKFDGGFAYDAVCDMLSKIESEYLDKCRASQYTRDAATISKRQNKPSKKVELTANDLNESSEPKQVQQPKDESSENKGAANSNEGEK